MLLSLVRASPSFTQPPQRARERGLQRLLVTRTQCRECDGCYPSLSLSMDLERRMLISSFPSYSVYLGHDTYAAS